MVPVVPVKLLLASAGVFHRGEKTALMGFLLNGTVNFYKPKAHMSSESAKFPMHPWLRSVYSEFPPGNLCTENSSPRCLCLRGKQQVNTHFNYPINMGTLEVLLQQAESSPWAEATHIPLCQKQLDVARVSRPP